MVLDSPPNATECVPPVSLSWALSCGITKILTCDLFSFAALGGRVYYISLGRNLQLCSPIKTHIHQVRGGAVITSVRFSEVKSAFCSVPVTSLCTESAVIFSKNIHLWLLVTISWSEGSEASWIQTHSNTHSQRCVYGVYSSLR